MTRHEHDDQIDPMVDAIKHFLQPDKKEGVLFMTFKQRLKARLPHQ
jgi:hypothetical protein